MVVFEWADVDEDVRVTCSLVLDKIDVFVGEAVAELLLDVDTLPDALRLLRGESDNNEEGEKEPVALGVREIRGLGVVFVDEDVDEECDGVTESVRVTRSTECVVVGVRLKKAEFVMHVVIEGKPLRVESEEKVTLGVLEIRGVTEIRAETDSDAVAIDVWL